VYDLPSNFVFLIHFHQPIGQLRSVIERIYENSYKLLLDIFREYSDLKFAVHISGPLLLYMRENHPDWLQDLLKLGDYGTIEFVAGTISESILPLVPGDLRLTQVLKYIEVFEGIAGYKPRGFWLPERVWEPWLPEVLGRAGLEYVVIDDATLRKTGWSSEKTKYAWITEESGYVIKVLFIDEKLRYILPWEHPDRVIDYIASYSGDPDALLLWGSDAEKFGEWWDRESSKWWLRDFLSKLRFEKRIEITHPSEYLREHGVKGLIYLDTGSYDKMLEWSGGFFRNFLVKYAESNNMHKKALWVKRKIDRASDKVKEAPLDYLLAYCNDAYWHGLFGGIYLMHLRQAIYEELIRSERSMEELMGYYNSNGVKRILLDFDYDGSDELLVESPLLNLYIDLGDGGTLFELDYKKPGLEHNFQDTMTRYREPYLEGYRLNPDWYRRVSWRLHIWGSETTIHDWVFNTPFRDMSDIAQAKHHVAFTEDPRVFHIRGFGGVYYHGVKASTIQVEKTIRLLSQGYIVKITLRNHGESIVKGKVGFEYHLAWKVDRDQGRPPWFSVNGRNYDITYWYTGRASSIALHSAAHPATIIKTSKPVEMWVARLTSYARTEKGLMEVPQGLGVMLVEQVELNKGGLFELEIEHVVE